VTRFILGIFIAAARVEALWPRPHRQLARAALVSLPPECFEADLEERLLAARRRREERWN